MLAPLVPLAFAALTSPPSDPPAIPSGLDLLYGDRVALDPSGEPLVAVGLMTGQTRVVLRAAVPLQVDFWEAGVLKRTNVQPGQPVEVTLRRGIAAKRQFYVDFEEVAFADTAALERTLARSRAAGHPEVTVLEEGMVLGIDGRVLDNRAYRVVVPTGSRREAERIRSAVYARSGAHAAIKTRLIERPWGELTIRAGGAPLGIATTFVRAVALDAVVEVEQVEFARGYSWHGRENRGYHGELYVVVDAEGKLAAVNVLGVETILEGVVPAELFASSHPEALKAQAVAARNHLLAKLGRQHHEDPFHLCSEQHCQVYAGVAKEDPRSTAAVRATRGEALFLGSALVPSFYSASCGGHTEDNDAVWGDAPHRALRGRADFDDAPALAAFAGPIDPGAMAAWIAVTPPSYCARASPSRPERIRWSKRFTASELARLIEPAYPGLGALTDLIVESRGPGGRVVNLRLVGERGMATAVRELPIRRLFGNLNSGAFVLEIERSAAGTLAAVTFRGGGWGHGVGMCQLGAIGRAEAGQSYRQILAHYFNGAQVKTLY